MIGTNNEQTRLYLEAVAAQIEAATILPGESPGLCVWLRMSTRAASSGSGTPEQLGEHGLFVQAYEVEHDDEVTFAGAVDWVCERAPVDEAVTVIRRYLTGPSVRPQSTPRPATPGSQVEQRQLQPQPQQPGLLGGHSRRVGSGQVT